MFAYLKMLANVGMTTRLQEEVEHLQQNVTDMFLQISEMLTLNNETSILDEIFNPQKHDLGPVTKLLLFVFFFFILLILNTTYNLLLIHYERFGGDPMKRSLINQLIAQTGYAEIFINFLVAPFGIIRIVIGPINHHLVEIQQVFVHSTMNWYVNIDHHVCMIIIN